MATVTTTAPRLTVEEFARLPDRGQPMELVRGELIRMNPPKPYHGYVCSNTTAIIREHVKAHDLGYVMSNDSGVVTGRNPDTLRGADVAYYGYAKLPKGSLRPRGPYLDVAPDLVVEVRSPDDRWPSVLEKVADYLNAGVPVVVLVDPEGRNAHVYSSESPVRLDAEGEELTVPEVLPGFAVTVGRFFD